MMRSLFSGVSGLKNHQTRMDVIGNNISNVNTTGFKSGRATFVDMLSQTQTGAASPNGNIGGTNPKQIGLGSSVGSIDLMFQDGSVQSTGKNTDLSLSGNGLFVVKRGNETFYTRDGAFEFDAEGNYVLPGSGLFVQGWMGNEGVVDTAKTVENIVVPAGKSMAATATSQVAYANNLDADIPMVVGISGGTSVNSYSWIESGSSVIKGYYGDLSRNAPLHVKINENTYDLVDIRGGDWDISKNWTVINYKPSTSTSGEVEVRITDEEGNKILLTIRAPGDVNLSGSVAPVNLENHILESTVYPPTEFDIVIDGKTYTVDRVVDNIDVTKNWIVNSNLDNYVKSGVIAISSDDPTIFSAIRINLKKSGETPPNNRSAISFVKPPISERKATTENPVTLTLSDGTTITQTSGVYKVGNSMPVTTTITVYDSLGATHEVPVYFIREGEYQDGVVTSVDKWLVSLTPDATVKKGDTTTYEFIESNGTKTKVSLNVAEVQFTSSGKLVTNSTDSNAPDTGKTATLTFTGGSIGTDGTNPGEPVEQSVTIDFSALTQFSGNNTINGTSNGNAAGTLKEIQIDSSGVITGVYTNGVRQAEAQVAVAQFTNATGLTKTGNSLYQESNNSGTANIKTASDLGVTITPSALEMSNVDVANEFADMIITQRGFQSNSKIVTVGDEMLETVINMKR